MKSERTALAGWGGTAPSVATVVDVRPDELDDAGGAAVADRSARRHRSRPRAFVRRPGTERRRHRDPARSRAPTRSGSHADCGHDHGRRRRQPRRAAAGDHPAGLVRAGRRPGTRFVTVGGAIASDVHGKGHHVDGIVRRPRQRDGDAAGRRRARGRSPPASDPDLWWATIGGMGLTGLILRATFGLIPIETQHILVVIERVPNFDSLLERMESPTITCTATRSPGSTWSPPASNSAGRRSARGNHATLDELRRHHAPFGGEPARRSIRP